MARGVNKVILIGNLGDEPALNRTQSNISVANISLVTNESRRNTETGAFQEFAEWHRVVLWNRLADFAEKYLHKGSQIYVEGKLRTRSYVDKNGVKRHVTEIVADEVQALGNRPQGVAPMNNNYQGQGGFAPVNNFQGNNQGFGQNYGMYGNQIPQNNFGNQNQFGSMNTAAAGISQYNPNDNMSDGFSVNNRAPQNSFNRDFNQAPMNQSFGMNNSSALANDSYDADMDPGLNQEPNFAVGKEENTAPNKESNNSVNDDDEIPF